MTRLWATCCLNAAVPLGPHRFCEQAVFGPPRPAGQAEHHQQHRGSQRPCRPSEPGCSILTSAPEGLSPSAVSSSCAANLWSRQDCRQGRLCWPRLPAGSGSRTADRFCSCHQCLWSSSWALRSELPRLPPGQGLVVSVVCEAPGSPPSCLKAFFPRAFSSQKHTPQPPLCESGHVGRAQLSPLHPVVELLLQGPAGLGGSGGGAPTSQAPRPLAPVSAVLAHDVSPPSPPPLAPLPLLRTALQSRAGVVGGTGVGAPGLRCAGCSHLVVTEAAVTAALTLCSGKPRRAFRIPCSLENNNYRYIQRGS